ncbi:MAG: hypothetical protein ACI89Z_000095 [Porticoccus sp.]|jgi:hypothetical protein
MLEFSRFGSSILFQWCRGSDCRVDSLRGAVSTGHFLPRLRVQPRFRLLIGVSGIFLADVTEIWVFSFAYYLLLMWGGYGSLEGNFDGSFLGCGYFSFSD